MPDDPPTGSGPPSNDTNPYDVDEDDPSLELLRDAQEALQDEHPLSLLAFASSIMSGLTRADESAYDRAEMIFGDEAEPGESLPALPSPTDLMSMFVESGQPALQALAYAMSRLSGNDLDRRRIDNQLGDTVRTLPRWLQSLDKADVVGALLAPDPVLAGANVAIGVRLRSGHHLTVISFIDFDLGSALTDAYALDMSLDGYAKEWKRLADDLVGDQLPITLADSRARLEAAIARGDLAVPPYESDSWPASRPLLEWILRKLPEGGTDFTEHLLSDDSRDAVIDGFLQSPHGKRWRTHRDVHRIIDLLLSSRAPHNDPLLWSPKAIDILLAVAPHRVIATEDFLRTIPTVLESLIRYGHEQRGAPQDCTANALDALMMAEHGFLIDVAQRYGSGGGEVEIDVSGWFGGPPGISEEFIAHAAQHGLDRLASRVGGAEALESLDDSPLPVDEPLDLTGIDPDAVDAVTTVGKLVDSTCAAVFEPDARTVARRILHRVAAEAPELFTGKGKPETAAAAVCWIAMINNIVGMGETWTSVKELMARLGLKGSPSSRAAPMLVALGAPAGARFDLRDVGLLTSTTRRSISSARDQQIALLNGD